MIDNNMIDARFGFLYVKHNQTTDIQLFMSKNTGTFLVFLAGAAVGATLGILYAPDEGKNLRSKFNFQLERYRDQLREYLGTVLRQDDGLLSEAKHEGQRVIDDTREKAEKLLMDVETLMGQLKQTR